MFGRARRKAAEHTINAVRPLLATTQHFQGLSAGFWQNEFVLGFIGLMISFHLNHTSGVRLSAADKRVLGADVLAALSNMNRQEIQCEFTRLAREPIPDPDFQKGGEYAAIYAFYTIGTTTTEGRPWIIKAEKMATDRGVSSDRTAIAECLFHLLFYEPLREKFGSNGVEEVSIEQDSQENESSADDVPSKLKELGYELTPHGANVAALQLKSGYSAADAASHIALTTLARDVKEAELELMTPLALPSHARTMLDVLKKYKEERHVSEELCANYARAIWGVVTVDKDQEKWIDGLLSDPVMGKERLAISRIDYD